MFALLDRAQHGHEATRPVVEAGEALILSLFVLAELDYLLTRRVSVSASIELLRDVEAGAYELAALTTEDIGAARELVERHRGLDIGLADASVVVLADRYATSRVLTLDERRFRMLTTADGTPFTLLPADA